MRTYGIPGQQGRPPVVIPRHSEGSRGAGASPRSLGVPRDDDDHCPTRPRGATATFDPNTHVGMIEGLMLAHMLLLALAVPEFVHRHLGWFAFFAIILIGLVLFGMRDLVRFSWTRVWAISGVCFDESIRRRVLWITPLAILGVIIVSQLQHPADHQDAIFQTTKFCIFATGTLLVITTIILACTNLPKEIDNRVIYTIVTKPTTRLEIVLGKILGFARVSAAILLIMGVFSLGYLKVRSMTLERDIRQRLSAGLVDPVSKPTWEHYART